METEGYHQENQGIAFFLEWQSWDNIITNINIISYKPSFVCCRVLWWRRKEGVGCPAIVELNRTEQVAGIWRVSIHFSEISLTEVFIFEVREQLLSFFGVSVTCFTPFFSFLAFGYVFMCWKCNPCLQCFFFKCFCISRLTNAHASEHMERK